MLDDHVKVNLEVYVADLEKFEELIPDEWFDQSSSDSTTASIKEWPSLEQRMHAFASKRLQFITEKGVKL